MRAQYRVSVILSLLVIPLTGCIVNRAISANAVADNLAVEKAQNEMLLLNVLRAKDHLPMYLTGISKITGSVKAEASLNPTVPFGSVTGGGGDLETGTRTHYMAAATATYNWNPSFDVNVLDTSEFMRGFLTPITGDTFAYYWNQDYPPELLFHLLVQKIQIRVKRDVCDTKNLALRQVDEYIFHNHPDASDPDLIQLKQFTQLVNQLIQQHPYFGGGDSEPLEPELTKDEALRSRAIIEALKDGYTLNKQSPAVAEEETDSAGGSRPDPEESGDQKVDKFRFQSVTTPMVLKMNNDSLKSLYQWIIAPPKGKKGRDENERVEAYTAKTDAVGCPAADRKLTKPEASTPGILYGSLTGRLTQTGLIKTSDDKPAKMTITFTLRSPEAILYYLGEVWHRLSSDGPGVLMREAWSIVPMPSLHRCSWFGIAAARAD